ncbi:L,D-transpeptidase family protein [Boseongicola aestuarii]|uniref:Murein L,D-transpeptidase n=1 Tax=Boseongicola aestuarii TaxID=1470561 RepID=A0A238IUM1_9RHOB|nr:L,D-transpeptidase family protein [Boseongicola aestuarii]SMX22007.1 murein L,D-transpeptidase [Boseongicola aestuarii]
MTIIKRLTFSAFLAFLILPLFAANPASAQSLAFKQAVAEASASDRDIAAFYKENGFQPIWTSASRADRLRRQALLDALSNASAHGLPVASYRADEISGLMRSARSDRQLGALEVTLSRIFLDYARDIQTGILVPSRVDDGLVREVPLRPRKATLAAFSKSSAKGFLNALPPKSAEYARLMKEKMRFERIVGRGGWGAEVVATSLKPGESNNSVLQLRNRLIAMGYLDRTPTSTYDNAIISAVKAFQVDHGLNDDGVVGPRTMEEINTSAATRLSQIVVAMERERWINMPLGKRHIWVNLTDFHARIVDDGKVTFQTRSVVGANDPERRTPEFSDVMDHMVINPTWNVPRSIATKEYLPLLKENPFAVSNLDIINVRGQIVSRAEMDFSGYDETNFPYDLKEPPSRGNALGLVKFMFPNRYNIYLHDTPAKSLFGREKRAFSHGCIRLKDPFDFAYTLLAKQERNPEGFFQSTLATRKETVVSLREPVQVHLVYRTAFTKAKGNIQFRGDVYGRDGKIWRALNNAGVVLTAQRG